MERIETVAMNYTMFTCKTICIGIKMENYIPEDLKNYYVQKTAQELSRFLVEEANVVAEKTKGGDFVITIYKINKNEVVDDQCNDRSSTISENEKAQYYKKDRTQLYNSLENDGSMTNHEVNTKESLERIINKIKETNHMDDPLSILFSMDRQIHTLEVPLYLFIIKNDLKEFIEILSKKHNCTINLIISFSILIIFSGRNEEVLSVREEIMSYFQKAIGKYTLLHDGYMPIRDCLKTNTNAFFVSKINCKRVLLSVDLQKNLGQYLSNTHIKEYVKLESFKFCYACYYIKVELEDVLCENDCYLSYEPPDNSFCLNVCVIGFCINKIRKCIKEIRRMLQDIILLSYNEKNRQNESFKAFTIEFDNPSQNKYLTVSTISEVKQMIEHDENVFEIEMIIDGDLEDFLCGKKNGKINKICKELNCEVFIESAIENREKLIVINITGTGLNLYSTICMLENEYPAEISFYLNEKHHRRIIGYGGKNIQKIMKKYGVYIKFMGEEEKIMSCATGNVVIKTPKRNLDNLEKMKEEVLLLADERYIKAIEEVVTMNLFTYYHYCFPQSKIRYDNVFITNCISKYLRLYVIDEADIPILVNDANNKIIHVENTSKFFCLSFNVYDYEVITNEHWFTPKANVSKLLNGYLMYVYEPKLKESENSIGYYKIDFSGTSKKNKVSHDEFIVGNPRTEKKHIK